MPTVLKAIKDGVDRAKACLVPLKKNLSLRDVSKPKVSYTGRKLAQSKRTECFLMNFGGSATAFKVPGFCHCPS